MEGEPGSRAGLHILETGDGPGQYHLAGKLRQQKVGNLYKEK